LNPKIPHSLSSLLNCNYLEKKERSLSLSLSLSQFLILSTRMDVPKDQITALLDNQLYNSAQILVIIFFFFLTICEKKIVKFCIYIYRVAFWFHHLLLVSKPAPSSKPKIRCPLSFHSHYFPFIFQFDTIYLFIFRFFLEMHCFAIESFAERLWVFLYACVCVCVYFLEESGI
jgi:hypothetical protein